MSTERTTQRSVWEDNIKVDVEEIVLEGVDWIHVADHRDQRWAVVSAVMNLQDL
jgi:hypothetical protein